LSIVLLEAALVSSAPAATMSWTNVNGGNWTVAANWSPNQVPGGGDQAIIAVAGAYTVTLNASVGVGSLTLGGSSGQQTLATAGNTLALNASSVVNASGILALNGGALTGGPLTVSGQLLWSAGAVGPGTAPFSIATNGSLVLAGVNGNPYTLGQPLTNAGAVYLQGGNLAISWCGGNNALFVNLPGGLVNLMADVSIDNSCGGPGFINQGTLVKSGGSTTSLIAPPFSNSGTVEANVGAISLTSATLNDGSVFLGTGQTLLSGGTIGFNGSLTSSNLVLAGANLQGNGVLSGLLTWTSGTLGAELTALTIAANSTLILAGVSGNNYSLGQYLTNAGTILLQSGNLNINWCQWGTLINLPGGVVDLQGDVSINACNNGSWFYNQGMVMKSGGLGTSTISAPFSNFGGSVGVTSGTLSLGGNSLAQGGGTFSVTLGGTNAGQSGELVGVANASLTGLLTVNLSNGFVPAPGSALQLLSCSSLSGLLSPLNVPAGLAVTYSNNGVFLTATGSVALAPAITLQPTNATVSYAGTASFRAVATGMSLLSYQWQANGINLHDGGQISGATSPNLSVEGVTDNNVGNYAVIITNAFGSVTSTPARLAVLNCTAAPSGLIAWWPGNGTFQEVVSGFNGVASGSVTFAPAEVGQGFHLVNSAISANGNFDFSANNSMTIELWFELNVDTTYNGLVSAPYCCSYRLMVEGGHRLFYNPGTHTDIVVGPALNLGQWYHAAMVIVGGGPALIYLDGQLIFSSGAGVPSVLPSVSTFLLGAGEGLGTYTMQDGVIDEASIYNRALSPDEIAAIYAAGSAGKCLTAGPAITGQPLSQSVLLGSTATFSVSATGVLPLSYQWAFDGTDLTDNGRITGSQSNVLTISNLQFADGGSYSVLVTNSVGVAASQLAALTVLRQTPAVTWTNPVGITYGTAMNNRQLNAMANVPGTFAYQPSAGAILDAGTYLLTAVFTPTDLVNYRPATNSVSLAVAPAPLTVTANAASRPYGAANPVFTGTLTGLQGVDNIRAAYTCAATPPSAPGPYAIVPSLVDPYARARNYSVTLNNGTLSVNAAAPPTLLAVSPATGSTNGGQTVTITGTDFELGAGVKFGSVSSPWVTVGSPTNLVAVTPPSVSGSVSVAILNPDGKSASLPNAYTFGVPPSLQLQPLSQSVVLGSNVQFQVQATGAAPLTYQWQFNGANLLNLPGFSGVRTPTLSLSNLASFEGGTY